MKPAATGPTTLASEGAMPSQLNTRIRSVLLWTSCPAVRWIVIKPMLAPTPDAAAPTQPRPNCQPPGSQQASSAQAAPTIVKATAKRAGRW